MVGIVGRRRSPLSVLGRPFHYSGVRLGTRLFAIMSLIVAATVVAVIWLASGILRRHFEQEIASGLQREAQLVARLVPPDSTHWEAAARQLGALTGHRVTLIAPDGRVRGDADFDQQSLAGLENHLQRPEVQAALRSGSGRAQRLSASTNARQMYVAVHGGPPGIAVVRLSATLDSVDGEVLSVQRAVGLAGLAALLVAAVIAWIASGALARPLVRLGGAARAIAAQRPPDFPHSSIPEVAEHILSLRTMHGDLEQRFAELRREREETAMLIEAMADGVLAADRTGRVTAMNSAARLLLGYGRTATLPPLEQLFHEKRSRELVHGIVAGGQVAQQELQVGPRALLASGRPLPDGGSLLVLRDITELRRLEQVRRDFVANVSHELKTPLTSIAGYAETLVHESQPGQPRQFAETILQNAKRMQHLVDDLLDLSRIESGGWRPAPEQVELDRAVREAWEAVAEAAERRGVALRRPAADAPRMVWADRGAVQQILTNLFDNAVRYTPAGGRIGVDAGATADELVLSVSDTGAGIPPEHLPRIFERFYRVDPARSRDAGGTGLGLAIVKHLMESHGGRVEAESTPGTGTTVRLHFPLPSSG
jgi:two-component system, OmpR family, phosphate regulon sensor histidine kinase PhoR